MVESRPPSPAGRFRQLCLLGLLFTGCLSPSVLEPRDPDQDLRDELENWDAARSSGDGQAYALAGPGSELGNLTFRHPRHVPTLVAAAAASYDAGNELQAQKLLDQALRQEPGHDAATLLRTRIACKDGQLTLARRQLEESLLLHPDHPDLHESLAGVLYLQGELDQAAVELNLAERLASEGESLHSIAYHRGLLAEARGEADVARAYYRRALEMDADHAPSQTRLRWLDAQF